MGHTRKGIRIDPSIGVDLQGVGTPTDATRNVRESAVTISTTAAYTGELSQGWYWVWSAEDCAIAVDTDAGFTATALTYTNGWPVAGATPAEKEGPIWVDEGMKIGVIGDSGSPGTASFYAHKGS